MGRDHLPVGSPDELERVGDQVVGAEIPDQGRMVMSMAPVQSTILQPPAALAMIQGARVDGGLETLSQRSCES